MKRNTAVILAGGKGVRMKTKVPKQFLNLKGRPVIVHSLKKFEKIKDITDIVVVCHRDHVAKMCSLIEKHKVKKIYKVVIGGPTRQRSSYNGLKNCPPGTGRVLIHDSSRPFVSERLIKDSLKSAGRAGAVMPVIETMDTIVEVKGGRVKKFLDRNALRNVQTPQAFRYGLILKAHEHALKKGVKNATDDCALVSGMGKKVECVKGDPRNKKITTRGDL